MSHANPSNAEDKTRLDAHFEKVAQTYERDGMGIQNAMCRTLLSIANELNNPITKSSVILDNASGPGILTGELLKQVPAGQIPELHAADFSAAMIRILDSKGWGEKYGVKSSVMDAQDLQYPDEKFTHIFMNLGIFALPDPVKGTKEIYRTLKPGGIALVTTIRGTGWLPPFQKAQKRIRPDAEEFHGMLPPEVSKSDWIKERLEKGGFKSSDIDVRESGEDMPMANFAEQQEGLVKMATGVIVKGWSDDEKAEFDKALSEELKLEADSSVPREMGIWVSIATK